MKQDVQDKPPEFIFIEVDVQPKINDTLVTMSGTS